MPTGEQVRRWVRELPAKTARFIRELPRNIAYVAAFSVPTALIAAALVMPVVFAVAWLAIVWVNQPGSVFDPDLIGDLALIAAVAVAFGALAAGIAWRAGFKDVLSAGLAIGPALVTGAGALVLLLIGALLVQAEFGRNDQVQTRLEVGLWIGVVALAAVGTLVVPVIIALRDWAGIRLEHMWLTPLAWLGIAVLLLLAVGEEPETPADAADAAGEKAEARYRRSPQPPNAEALARKYQPVLLFHPTEPYRPLDAEQLFEERGTDGQPSHQVCSDTRLGYDCSDVAHVDDLEALSAEHRAVIALDANPAKNPPTRGRIYYHVDANDPDGRVHVDYWIFYRYNDSPKFSKHTCLSGLSFEELTCFDHEGDWEGITVTLKPDGEADSVAYAGHKWRYRFDWEDLERLGVVKRDRPRVWVAWGSHASYPAACGHRVRKRGKLARVSCNQPETDVPDGDRGDERWHCGSDCLRPLPQDAQGRPTRWAAFSGYWGAPRCTVGTRLCTRSRGPATPPFQKRYREPGAKVQDRGLLYQWYGDEVRKLPRRGGA